MKVKLFGLRPSSTEARLREQRETGKLKRAIEREMKQRYDRWED
jgi:hypothetical protein